MPPNIGCKVGIIWDTSPKSKDPVKSPPCIISSWEFQDLTDS